MPIYEYQCHHCKTRFELIRRSCHADEPVKCESCGSKKTSRQLSTFFSPSTLKTSDSGRSGCSGCAGGNCASCH